MKGCITFIVAILCISFFACRSAHKMGKEACESGIIESMDDWQMETRNKTGDRDTLRYKYDTSVYVQRNYFDDARTQPRGNMCYYKNKPQGTVVIYNNDGSVASQLHFDDGKMHGIFSVYDKGRIVIRTKYVKGVPLYQVTFDESGKVKDSVAGTIR